jgi:hypothetical protein
MGVESVEMSLEILKLGQRYHYSLRKDIIALPMMDNPGF